MKTSTFLALGLLLAPSLTAAAPPSSPADAARADIQRTFGFVPSFMNAVPEALLPGYWAEMKTLQGSDSTALPCKIKELIGLAVAAQIPCDYCVIAHTEFAKLGGATDQEIREAVGMGAQGRHWSTIFNGAQIDEARFKADLAKAVELARQAATAKGPAPKAIDVVDAASARKDIAQTLGFVPDFMNAIPEHSLAGAWLQMRDLEMSPTSALPGKYKSLIGLGVAAQIPCHYCVIADTTFAQLDGATAAEIKEAIAMAAFTRESSALLNGLQVDKAVYKKELARAVERLKKDTKQASR